MFLHNTLDFALIDGTYICGLDESSISPRSLASTLTLEVKRVRKLVNFFSRRLIHWRKYHVVLTAGITDEAANLLLQ